MIYNQYFYSKKRNGKKYWPRVKRSYSSRYNLSISIYSYKYLSIDSFNVKTISSPSYVYLPVSTLYLRHLYVSLIFKDSMPHPDI